jgi:ATP-binding cassette, subfamily F, member 3
MIAFNQVCKHYGTQDVLTNVSFEILPGRKVGLIGPNGAGKTTLIRILAGEEEPSSGSVTRAPGLRIGLVPQHVEAPPGATVAGWLLEEHRAAEEELRGAEARLAGAPEPDVERALADYQAALDAFDALGGEDAPRRLEGLLESLGLPGSLPRIVATMSGGERNVLALARVLARRPSLLVLDEPGNHLDFAGLAWLERFLQEWDGAVLVVSHNRYLLDRVVDRVLDLESTRLTEYEGNYSEYRLERLRGLVTQQADYVANQKRLAQLEALVARFAQIARAHPDPAWGRRLHSRKTQLAKERERAVEKPVLSMARMAVAARVEETRADIAVQVNAYSKAFGDRVLFREASLLVACGERVALVGPNGSGKTTFLRDLVERGSWDDRTLRIGPSLSVGYCAQHQETIDAGRTILEEFQEAGARTRREVFAAVAGFLFTWEDLDKRIGELSGGERNRLQLALIMMRRANLLVLDEPTNHMDIPSCESIEESLAVFPGTILVVSHDRYFLDKIATAIVEVTDRGFRRHAGSFTEFWAGQEPFLVRGRSRVLTRGRQMDRSRREPERTVPASGAERKRVADLERRITEQEADKRRLETEITEAFTRGAHQEGRRLANRLASVSRMLEELYREWEAAAG